MTKIGIDKHHLVKVIQDKVVTIILIVIMSIDKVSTVTLTITIITITITIMRITIINNQTTTIKVKWESSLYQPALLI